MEDIHWQERAGSKRVARLLEVVHAQVSITTVPVETSQAPGCGLLTRVEVLAVLLAEGHQSLRDKIKGFQRDVYLLNSAAASGVHGVSV